MTKLITMLVTFFPALISGFINYFGRKWAVFGATSLLFVALTVAFVGVVNGFVQQMLALAVAPGWANAIGNGIPSDFGVCVSALVSCRIAHAAYELAMEKAKAFNTAQ